MKKWSTSLLVLAALATVAIAAPATSSAAGTSPYCPTGQTGTPPNCVTPTPPPPPPPPTCAAGQVGTYPNCVTPSLEVMEVKLSPNHSAVKLMFNAPGKVKVSGHGVKVKTSRVHAGSNKIMVKLTKSEKAELKKKGEVKLKVTITYTPTGCTPVKKKVTIVIKSKASSKSRESHGKSQKGH